MANPPLSITMLSPIPVYLDESTAGSALAPRPATLEGKVLGLLPNWRPSAVHILQAMGALLQERYRLKAVVLEQPVRELPIRTGKLLDTMREKLDDFAQRVDVAITATGDWGSCTTWCSHVTPALEARGIPTVMITTDTFSKFARRMSSTQGCPYVIIAETPNPIRQLEPEAMRARAETMIATVIEGLTLPPAEIEARLKDVARREIRPEGVVRSATPV